MSNLLGTDDPSVVSVVEAAFAAAIRADAVLNNLLQTSLETSDRFLPRSYPAITFGDTIESANDGGPRDYSAFGGTQGYDLVVTLDVWSLNGNDECERIKQRLKRLFNKPTNGLDLGTYHCVGSLFDGSSPPMGDPEDQRVTHMPVRFRVGAQEEAA